MTHPIQANHHAAGEHVHEHEPGTPLTPGLTLRLPKPNWQVTALLLIALIAAFQTIQLARLKNNASAKTVSAASSASSTAAPASSSSAGSGSGDLQSQVGGC